MEKKLLFTVVLLVLSLSMVACGNDTTNTKNNTPTEEVVTTAENSENETTEDETTESEISNSENINNEEDGYEIVENINIDSEQATLKYVGYEMTEEPSSTDYETLTPNIVLYFEFENKSGTRSFDSTFNVSVFQNGIECIYWLGGSTNTADNEFVRNWVTETLSGGSLKVGVEFELQNADDSIKIRVDNLKYDENGEPPELIYQQQELSIK